MGQIVGTKREELGFLGDLSGDQSGPRQFDHRSYEIVHPASLFLEDLFRDTPHNCALVRHLFECGSERNHDLGMCLNAFLVHFHGGFEYGSRLHFRNFRVSNTKAAATMPEHGIECVQFFDPAHQGRKQLIQISRSIGAILTIFLDQRLFLLPSRMGKRSQIYHQLLAFRQKLVQRRIKQANGHRQASHGLEQANEVGALHWQQFLERGTPILFVVRKDHGAHMRNAVPLEEHVLGATESDALSPKRARLNGVTRNIGVGANSYFPEWLSPAQ